MNDIKEKTEFDELQELIERKKKNLLWQKKLREESKELDIAIARHPRVNEQVIQLSNTGGSHRVTLDDFDSDIKVVMVPLEVTHPAIATESILKQLLYKLLRYN